MKDGQVPYTFEYDEASNELHLDITEVAAPPRGAPAEHVTSRHDRQGRVVGYTIHAVRDTVATPRSEPQPRAPHAEGLAGPQLARAREVLRGPAHQV
jgi:hypothetical protein